MSTLILGLVRSAPSWSSRRVRWAWRAAVAAFASVMAIVALPGVAFAAWPLPVNQPLNAGANMDFTFTFKVPRWNVVFLHPYSAAGFDADLSVTGPGQLGQYGHTQTSEQGGNAMDFIALNNHSLPLGQYSAKTWIYSGSGMYQIIPRTSSGTISPNAYTSTRQFTTGSAMGTNGALLGNIYDLKMAQGQNYIISAETRGGVFLVSDYWTNDGDLSHPLVQVHGISRWLSLYQLRTDEKCMRVTGNGQLYGLVILFRDGLTRDEGKERIFNVRTATEAQAKASGCRHANFGL